jgi:transposase InsO family protein
LKNLDLFFEGKISASEVCKKFKVFVEKKIGYCIKSLIFDRGGEFTYNKFKEFCEANGIHRPLTILRSPQQNGVVERNNRIILNMTRSMLKTKRMPKEFLVEVVDCAVYFLNRCPTKSL